MIGTKDEIIAKIAERYFNVYELNDGKTHDVKIGSRVLRAALRQAYEAGESDGVDMDRIVKETAKQVAAEISKKYY